jgi:hypothetical protein
VAKINRKGRRGLSTVIGAVFMIFITIGALNVVLWTMQQQNSVTQSIIERTNSNFNKLNENIEISNVRVDGKKLNMTVTNTGGAASTLKAIYIVNETSKEQFRYDLNIVIDGRKSQSNVGQGIPLSIKDNVKYSVRLVTESGNTVATTLAPVSSVALPMALYVIPPTFTPGENVTVLYTVTNNMTDSQLTGPIDLKLRYTVDCSPLGSQNCNVTQYVKPPSNITTIAKGSTALFKWVFKVQIPDENYIRFNASLANAKQGNYVIESGLSRLIDASRTSFTSEIIVSSNLVQKPEIFVLLPNPFGDSVDKGLWGVIVANPTEVDMKISRIVVNVYSSRPTGAGGGGGQEMIDSGSCAPAPIFPLSGWSCPHDNTFEWKDINSPVTIRGFEAASFLAKIKPGDIGQDESAMMASVAVFTNMGQFTKTGYSAGMSASGESLASVYLTDSGGTAFRGNQTITAGQPVTLYTAMADLDTSSTTKIQSGTKLVVNVPKGFTNVNAAQGQPGFGTITKTNFADGSTQIVAPLNEELGNVSTEVKVLTITATAPPAPDPPAKRIYVMYALMDGQTSTSFSAGALAEIALVVKP